MGATHDPSDHNPFSIICSHHLLLCWHDYRYFHHSRFGNPYLLHPYPQIWQDLQRALMELIRTLLCGVGSWHNILVLLPRLHNLRPDLGRSLHPLLRRSRSVRLIPKHKTPSNLYDSREYRPDRNICLLATVHDSPDVSGCLGDDNLVSAGDWSCPRCLQPPRGKYPNPRQSYLWHSVSNRSGGLSSNGTCSVGSQQLRNLLVPNGSHLHSSVHNRFSPLLRAVGKQVWNAPCLLSLWQTYLQIWEQNRKAQNQHQPFGCLWSCRHNRNRLLSCGNFVVWW